MKHLLLAAVLLVGCKKSSDDKNQWLPDPTKPHAITESEAKRGRDACSTYVTKICACADKSPDRKDVVEACKLAKGYPEALEVGLGVATSGDSERRDVLQSQDSVRKTMAKCIEENAKLPLLGCT